MNKNTSLTDILYMEYNLHRTPSIYAKALHNSYAELKEENEEEEEEVKRTVTSEKHMGMSKS